MLRSAEGTVRPAISCKSYPQPYPQPVDRPVDGQQRGRACPPVLKSERGGVYTPPKNIFAKVKRI